MTRSRTIQSYQSTSKHQVVRISALLLRLHRKALTGRATYLSSSVQTFSVSGTTGQVKLNAVGCAVKPIWYQLALWMRTVPKISLCAIWWTASSFIQVVSRALKRRRLLSGTISLLTNGRLYPRWMLQGKELQFVLLTAQSMSFAVRITARVN